jgi:signal transduction histidine kinase
VRPPRVLRTTSFRLAAVYAALFGASVVVLGAMVLLLTRTALERQMHARIEAEAATLEVEFREGGMERLVASVSERSTTLRALDYAVFGPDGKRLAGVLPSPGSQLGWVRLQGPLPEPDGEYEPALVKVVALPGSARLLVGDDTGPIEDLDEAILRAFGWGLALTVLLAVLGGLALSFNFLRRIDAITQTAEAIVQGKMSERVPDRGTDDDLDRIARALNRMLDRIGELVDGLRQVSSDVAHQLRTPLTRLRQRLEAARAGARTVAEYQDAVEDSIAETDAVLETFAALLRIAQIEAGTRRAGFRQVDLAEVASSVVEAFAPSAEEEGRALALSAKKACIHGDQELLTQMLANLVENGIRHTPVGTRIEVAVRPTPSGVSLVVSDNGPGVAIEERERLFRRFHRLERSRAIAGSGLGLSLVAAVADLHGARILLGDNVPGLCVTLDFSASSPPTHGTAIS